MPYEIYNPQIPPCILQTLMKLSFQYQDFQIEETSDCKINVDIFNKETIGLTDVKGLFKALCNSMLHEIPSCEQQQRVYHSNRLANKACHNEWNDLSLRRILPLPR